MAKAQLRGRTTTIAFVYMHIGAKHMLGLAEASRDGQLYTLISSLVYSAFTLEAYVNHLGAMRHADWEETERKQALRKKYKRLAKEAGVKPDFNVRPYRALIDLFAFRDRMAHGRTTTEAVNKVIDADGPRLPQVASDPEWQAFVTIENARAAIEDVEALVKALHKESGYTGNPFARSGGGFYAVTRA